MEHFNELCEALPSVLANRASHLRYALAGPAGTEIHSRVNTAAAFCRLGLIDHAAVFVNRAEIAAARADRLQERIKDIVGADREDLIEALLALIYPESPCHGADAHPTTGPGPRRPRDPLTRTGGG